MSVVFSRVTFLTGVVAMVGVLLHKAAIPAMSFEDTMRTLIMAIAFMVAGIGFCVVFGSGRR